MKIDLRKYGFTDDHGHPLENCRDYIRYQDEVDARIKELEELWRVSLKQTEEWTAKCLSLQEEDSYDSGYERAIEDALIAIDSLRLGWTGDVGKGALKSAYEATKQLALLE